MKILPLIFMTLFMACQTAEKPNFNGEIADEVEELILQDSVTEEQKEIDEFYGQDTLLISEIMSEEGHQVELRGSRSNDVYRIDVLTNKGVSHEFQVAEYWYPAAHQRIDWINEDHILLYMGCGTSCWLAKVLSLEDGGIRDYMHHCYSDSVTSTILHPDKETGELLVTDMKTANSRLIELPNCGRSAMGIADDVISVEKKGASEILINYLGEDCEEQATQLIEIKN